MKIYSYYSEVPEINPENELRLSILWRDRWKAAGHEPIILNEWYARKHPRFAEYNGVVSGLPSVNPPLYERACYLRWLALAYIGGGYMTDLDVIPRTSEAFQHPPLPVPDAPSPCVILYQAPCCPCMVWAEQGGLDLLVDAVISRGPGLGSRPQGERPHYSDQYALDDLCAAKVPWLHIRDVVKIWGDHGWEQSQFIHFPNVVCASRGPKHAVIQSLDAQTFLAKQ